MKSDELFKIHINYKYNRGIDSPQKFEINDIRYRFFGCDDPDNFIFDGNYIGNEIFCYENTFNGYAVKYCRLLNLII